MRQNESGDANDAMAEHQPAPSLSRKRRRSSDHGSPSFAREAAKARVKRVRMVEQAKVEGK